MKIKRIMSLNVNDFGGKTSHLMNYRYLNENDKKYYIDWKAWAKIDKTKTWEKLKAYIEKKKPDLMFLEEMLVSRSESIDFIGDLEKMGYSYVDECLPKSGNYSLTMAFYKNGNSNPEYINSPGSYRENRSVVCRYDDILICGSHFPFDSDEVFLKHMSEYADKNLNDDFLLIGDLNASDPEKANRKMVNELLEKGAVDIWIAHGNKDMPTEARSRGRLDYAIASPSLANRIVTIDIDLSTMNGGITDHAAVIVDIEI